MNGQFNSQESRSIAILSVAFFGLGGVIIGVHGVNRLVSGDEDGAVVVMIALISLALATASMQLLRTKDTQKNAIPRANQKEISEPQKGHVNVSKISTIYDQAKSLFISLVVLAVVLFILNLIWNSLVVPGYEKLFKHYDSPWWTGTEYQKVCEDFGNEKCYTLLVTAEGKDVTEVSFPNGGYLRGSGECYKAAEGYYEYDRFCRFWDQQGRQWDVIPTKP